MTRPSQARHPLPSRSKPAASPIKSDQDQRAPGGARHGEHCEQETAGRASGAVEKSYGSFLKNNMRDYGMLLSLVAIMGFFQYMTDGTLMQPLNLTNLVLQNSYIVIMALGMLMVIVAGHIDSVGGSVVASSARWPPS
jgi:hypothetical protein